MQRTRNTTTNRDGFLVFDVNFDLFGSLDFETQILHRPPFSHVVHLGLDLKDANDGLLACALPHLIAA